MSDYVTSTSSCTSTHPIPVLLQPETSEERELVENLAVCADQAHRSMMLLNRSEDTVWMVDGYRRGPAEPETPRVVGAYREAIARAYSPAAAPLVLEPGSPATYVRTESGQIRLRLDTELQMAWQATAVAFDALQGKAIDVAQNFLARGSTSRVAITTCAFEAYKAGTDLMDIEEPDAFESLNTVMGVRGNYSACASAVRTARAPRTTGAPVPVVVDDLARQALAAQQRTTSLVGAAMKAGRIVAFLR